MDTEKNFLKRLGKVFVGLLFITTIIIPVFFLVGFFVQGMSLVYIEKNGLFILCSMIVASLLFLPVRRWRKEIVEDIINITLP